MRIGPGVVLSRALASTFMGIFGASIANSCSGTRSVDNLHYICKAEKVIE